MSGPFNSFRCRSVELDVRDAVGDVGLVAEGVGAEVEELDVAVVVAGADAALVVVVGVAEGDGPAVARGLALFGF